MSYNNLIILAMPPNICKTHHGYIYIDYYYIKKKVDQYLNNKAHDDYCNEQNIYYWISGG